MSSTDEVKLYMLSKLNENEYELILKKNILSKKELKGIFNAIKVMLNE